MTTLPSANTATQADRFRIARSAVQAWRGACIGLMADIEYRLSSVLLLTVGHPACPGKAGTLHLTGHKFERLRQILMHAGPVSATVPSAIAILDRYAQFDDLRTYLAHANLELSETEQGIIHWTLRLLRFSSGTATRSVLVMTEAEAHAARKALFDAGRGVLWMFHQIEAVLAVPARPISAYPAPIALGSYPLVVAPSAAALNPAAAIPRS